MTTRKQHIIYTRDEVVPLSADDPDMLNGWRNVPVPPTNDGGWVIFDNTTSDKATGWIRAYLQWGHS